MSTPLVSIIRHDFVTSNALRTSQITLEDVMSHRSGMPRHDLSYGFEGTNTPRDLTRNIRNLLVHTDIRTTMEYCNIGYTAASHALEVITGKPLNEILREWIWRPLGMNQTYAGILEAEPATKRKGEILARSHVWSKLPCNKDYDQGTLSERPQQDLSIVSGAGYVISTVDDYAKWVRCLLTQSFPLSPSIVQDLFTPRSICSISDPESLPLQGNLMLYALGWFVGIYRGHRIVYHPGGAIGCGSRVLLAPDIKWGATFLANGHDSGALSRGLLFELLDSALGIVPDGNSVYAICEKAIVPTYRAYLDIQEEIKRKYFPLDPAIRVSLVLPLEYYAGIYKNAGYGTLTFTATSTSSDEEDVLTCKISDRTWMSDLTIKHYNAESWCVTSQVPWHEVRRAESRIDARTGKVKWFGISMETSMVETLIWFEKVEGKDDADEGER